MPYRFSATSPRNTPLFRDRKDPSSYRILLWMFLILAGIWMLLQLRSQDGAVKPLFLPTPTPTRTAISYMLQAQAYFQAGQIDDPNSDADAIGAYQQTIALEPDNVQARIELARLLTYSSSLLPTVEERRARLQEALGYIQEAVTLAPENSSAHAVHAFVLDWSASLAPTTEESQALLSQAEQAASQAILLNPDDPLALTFYAEIQADLNRWADAREHVTQAIALAPDLMDAYRVYGYVLEAVGEYNAAIEQYVKASEITPNLTFLYISIGLNYRTLAQKATSKKVADLLYTNALEAFARAATINEALGIRHPLPYIQIAKTYSQQGEFFVAARNAEKALDFDPTDANTYGQLGIIYVKSRNFEGALPVLKCAVQGCSAAENKAATGHEVAITPLPLSSESVAYYYLQYASVLAALDMCTDAAPVLEQVNQAFPENAIMQSIIRENYAICSLDR